MKPLHFNLRRMLLAVALVALGLCMMTHLTTPYAAVFMAGSVGIGITFGAAVGLITNRPKRWMLIGGLGWLLFSIYAVIA